MGPYLTELLLTLNLERILGICVDTAMVTASSTASFRKNLCRGAVPGAPRLVGHCRLH